MERYFTIKLEDAIVAGKINYAPNCQDPGQARFTRLEDVCVTYWKIIKTRKAASASESGDWRNRSFVDWL